MLTPRDDPVVRMSEWEYLLCRQAAALRQAENLTRGRVNTNGLAKDFVKNLEVDVVGVCAEMAVANYFDVYPRSLFSFGEADVAGHEVKGTTYPRGSLVVQVRHATECINRKFILVCGDGLSWTLRGWMTGSEIMRYPLEERVPGRPAYWVPQSALLPMKDI